MGDKKKGSYELLQGDEKNESYKLLQDNIQKMLNAQTQILLDKMSSQQNMNDKKGTEKIKWEYEQEIKKKDEENRKLQKALEEEKKERESIEQKWNKAREDNKQLQSEKEDIDKELSIYKTRYREIDEAYNTYVRLSQEAKNRLKNVFKADSIDGFIAASAEWRNVEGLWSFAKRHIVERETADTEELISLFEFMLRSYNLQGSEKKCEPLVPAIGDKFDSDRHTIIGIKTDGFVSKVRLPGIIDLDSAKVIQKALIEV